METHADVTSALGIAGAHCLGAALHTGTAAAHSASRPRVVSHCVPKMQLYILHDFQGSPASHKGPYQIVACICRALNGTLRLNLESTEMDSKSLLFQKRLENDHKHTQKNLPK